MSKSKSATAGFNHQPDQIRLRREMRAARTAMTSFERQNASAKIVDSIVHSNWFQRAKSIACYLPMEEEVDTWLVIARAWRMKKRIFVPVVRKKSVMQFRELTSETPLFVTQYGLKEPREGKLISPQALDIVITPGVAFDIDGNRIGMGGGYYDRTFAFLRHRRHFIIPKLIGVAFACQRVGKITPNPWDIRVFSVIDETTIQKKLLHAAR